MKTIQILKRMINNILLCPYPFFNNYHHPYIELILSEQSNVNIAEKILSTKKTLCSALRSARTKYLLICPGSGGSFAQSHTALSVKYVTRRRHSTNLL